MPGVNMPQYTDTNGGANTVKMSNGYPENANNSPNSSQISADGSGHHSNDGGPTLISRTQKQHTTQQVTTTTKTIREIQYIGPDGQPLEYVPTSTSAAPLSHHPRLSTSSVTGGYDPSSTGGGGGQGGGGYPPPIENRSSSTAFGGPGGPNPQGGQQAYANYAEYPHRPPTPPSPSDRSSSPPPQHREPDYMRKTSSNSGVGGGYPPRSGYDELDTTLMPPRPGEAYNRGSPGPSATGSMSGSQGGPPAQPFPVAPGQGVGSFRPRYGSVEPETISVGNLDNSVFEEAAPRAMFDEDQDSAGQAPNNEPPPMHRSKSSLGAQSRGVPGVHWRDPDLHEVIEFLNNPNNVIKANAAAYLQHLCYMDDPVKAKTRQLGGIAPLVALLTHDIPEIHRNACGALRNLSYGRQNDENKRAIKAAGGVTALVRLLRKTTDNEVKELVTGVLWNLSSCDDLKRIIIDEALLVLVNIVIIPHSGWDPNGPGNDTHWTTVLRNSSGILRNISSAGDYGRKKLRECEGLVDSVLYLVKKAIEKAYIDNKSVENCVCVLRNLSYRSQEIEDPNYDKKQILVGSAGANGGLETRAGAKPNSDNLGCFGAGKGKRKDSAQSTPPNPSSSRGPRSGPSKGMDLLWQPEVVQPYLNLLSNCSNPETLEAAAGAIQNLSACYWQPSIDIRAAVRKEKGLPILVELLRMEVDKVVCAVATALRNLAIDQRNKELIGKYAMRDLVQKLPAGNQQDVGTSDDTIAAVLATLNEVIKKHPEFSRSLLEAGGVDRLMMITRHRQRFSSRVVKFASQVLYSMWVHQELRDVYRKSGWKETDFVTKTIAARNARPNSPTNLNSTLNRPMASQSGTRYEDRTMQRGGAAGGGAIAAHMNNSAAGFMPEEVQMQNMSLYSGRDGGGNGSQGGNAAAQQQAMYAAHHGNHLVRPGEPVYAQVNRDKKKNSRPVQGDPTQQQQLLMHYGDYSEHADHWQQQTNPQQTPPQQQQHIHGPAAAPAGDSWV